MTYNLKNFNTLKILGILGLLLLALMATSVSASTQRSVATLSGDIAVNGNSIPVHDGSLSVTGSNFSQSRNQMDSKVRKDLIPIAVDPTVYSSRLMVGTSKTSTVYVPASNYYARGESVRYPVYGAVSFSEYYQ